MSLYLTITITSQTDQARTLIKHTTVNQITKLILRPVPRIPALWHSFNCTEKVSCPFTTLLVPQMDHNRSHSASDSHSVYSQCSISHAVLYKTMRVMINSRAVPPAGAHESPISPVRS